MRLIECFSCGDEIRSPVCMLCACSVTVTRQLNFKLKSNRLKQVLWSHTQAKLRDHDCQPDASCGSISRRLFLICPFGCISDPRFSPFLSRLDHGGHCGHGAVERQVLAFTYTSTNANGMQFVEEAGQYATRQFRKIVVLRKKNKKKRKTRQECLI